MLGIIHILSPLIFYGYVKLLTNTCKPCPDSATMKYYKRIHNIILSILSFVMLFAVLVYNIIDDKISSYEDIVCKQYKSTDSIEFIGYTFFYSKYIEWLDTLFLYLSGREITSLQYNHHMTTAVLTYFNMRYFISPSLLVFMGLNCFVHIPMYWYFAYPRGFLKKYRKLITIIQILQHIIALSTTIYVLFIKQFVSCNHSKFGIQLGFCLYVMNLVYFTQFFIKTYLAKRQIKKNN